jgi:RNA polymerase sigma-70 factor (ECF subfamily)
MLASVRDRDEAHDLVQETFVRVWDHRGSLQPELPFLGYLLRIARNLVRDAAKRSAVRTKYAPEVEQPSGDDPDGSLRHRLLEEAVFEIVRTRLPEKCREVFLLSRIEGWSTVQIAGQLGISPKTVENQLTKALRIVRQRLSERMGGEL